jgi:hypothetical protein
MKSDLDRISHILAQGAARRNNLEGSTRRQQKHDMLLKFMAQTEKLQHKPAPARPSILKAIMSLFF